MAKTKACKNIAIAFQHMAMTSIFYTKIVSKIVNVKGKSKLKHVYRFLHEHNNIRLLIVLLM